MNMRNLQVWVRYLDSSDIQSLTFSFEYLALDDHHLYVAYDCNLIFPK